MILIQCLCGCGQYLNEFDNKHRKRKFIHGHNSIFISHKGQVPWNKGLKDCYSEETKKSISNSQKGKHSSPDTEFKKGQVSKEKHPRWNGGSSISIQIRGCENYKEWRDSIFKRDDYKCQICKKYGVDLNAHHKKYFSKIIKENNIISLEDAIKCKELWDTSNGITLCKNCHNKFPKNS